MVFLTHIVLLSFVYCIVLNKYLHFQSCISFRTVINCKPENHNQKYYECIVKQQVYAIVSMCTTMSKFIYLIYLFELVSIHILNCKMTLCLGIRLLLYFLKMSAGHGLNCFNQLASDTSCIKAV